MKNEIRLLVEHYKFMLEHWEIKQYESGQVYGLGLQEGVCETLEDVIEDLEEILDDYERI